MRILRTIIALMLLTVAAGSATAQTLKAQKVYMFGFSASFNDSTVYLTHIQEVPNCYVNEKSNMLVSRGEYSSQLRHYLRTRGNQSPTCITFWSTDRRKIDKKYANIRTKYIDKAKIKYDIRYVKDDEFHYTAVPLANNGNATATTNGK